MHHYLSPKLVSLLHSMISSKLLFIQIQTVHHIWSLDCSSLQEKSWENVYTVIYDSWDSHKFSFLTLFIFISFRHLHHRHREQRVLWARHIDNLFVHGSRVRSSLNLLDCVFITNISNKTIRSCSYRKSNTFSTLTSILMRMLKYILWKKSTTRWVS